MKFNHLGSQLGKHLGRNLLVASLSAAIGLGATSCSRDYVAAYVYAPSSGGSNNVGSISAYAVDYQTGILNQVSGSPFGTQFGNATTVIAAPDGKHLYLVGGSQNAQIEVFGIGTDGKLYGAQTVNLTGTYPTGAAMDSTGAYLYVTYTYQTAFGPNNPGPGGVTVFTLDTNSGDANYGQVTATANVNVGVNPIGVAVTVPVSSYNNAVFAYVVQAPTSTAGQIVEFTQNTTTGMLTATGNTIAAAVTPSGIIVEPTGRYLYVSDKTSNQIYGYQLINTAGQLQALPSSPYSTGLYPVAMTIDPRGKYLYTANYNSNTVSGFTINHADGSLGGIASTGSFTTATGPTCVTVDPSVGIYLYTSNRLDGSISGAQLTTEDGSLKAVANTPFSTQSLPSCVTSVANGSHALSLIFPN
jgi:6-phosphogluconolactonase